MVRIVRKRTSSRSSTNWHPEQGLISAVLNEADHVTPAERGVTPDWFHSYGDEWRFIEKQVKRHKQVPSSSFFLRRFPEFDVVKVYDVSGLIDEVKEEHARYTLLDLVQSVVEGIDEGTKPSELLTATERDVARLRSQTDGSFNEANLVDDWRASFSEARIRADRAIRSAAGLPGIPSGWPTLDDVTGGYGDSEYWIMASRLGGGKTWSLIQHACVALANGFTVQYDAMEQSRTQILMRAHNLLSSNYGRQVFGAHDLRRGTGIDLVAYRKFLRDLKRHINGRMFVDDTPRGRVTIASIAAQIERNQPHIVFIDYLGLMNKTKGDWGAMAQLSGDLKALATTYSIPIVAAAQLNRAGAGKEPPGPEALAEADAIGHDADGLITMASQSLRVKKFRLAKFRHGPDGMKWYCALDLKKGTFREVTGDEAADLKDQDDSE